MSDDLFSTRSEQTAQHLMGDSAEFVRAKHAFVGSWLAVLFQRILLGLILLEIPIQIDSYLMHDAESARFGAISGFNVSLTTLCLILLYLQWLPRHVVESKRLVTCWTLTVYIGITAMTILWAGDRSRTLFQLFLLLQAFMIFIYIVNHVKSRKDVMFVLAMLILGLACQSAMMWMVKLKGDDISIGPIVFHYYQGAGRVAGSFGSPNVASSYLAFLIAPTFSLLLVPISKLTKLAVAITFILASFCLAFTMSRGGWLSVAISMMLFFPIALRKKWFSSTAFFILLGLGLICSAGLYGTVVSRLFEDDAGSAMSRVPLAEISQRMIIEHPLGVGANNWDRVAKGYAEESQFRAEWYYTVHNKYLLVLSETGWLGLAAFLSFLAVIVVSGRRAINANSRWLSPIALGLTVAVVGQLIHMCFDVFNSRLQIQLLFLVAALIVAISNILVAQENESQATNSPLNTGNLA